MKRQIPILFFALLVVLGCISINSTPSAPQSELEADTQDPKILEGNTEIKIPEQATEIYGHIDGFRDVDTEARFIIHPEDLDEFLSSTSCVLPLLKDDVRVSFQNQLDRPWWKPSNAREFQWCHGEKEHLYQKIFIDTTSPDKYIVYVMAQTK